MEIAFPHILSEISIIFFELGDLETAMLNINEAILLCDTNTPPVDRFLYETRKRIIENELKGTNNGADDWERRIESMANQVSFRFLLPETIFQVLLIMLYLNFPFLDQKIKEGLEIFRQRFSNSNQSLKLKLEILEMNLYLNRISREGLMNLRYLEKKKNIMNYPDKRLVKLAILLHIQIRLLEYKLNSNKELEEKLRKLINELLTVSKKDNSVQFKIASNILSSTVFWLF